MRVPTPHPKTMRAFAKMLLEKKKKSVIIFLTTFFLSKIVLINCFKLHLVLQVRQLNFFKKFC